jgi:2-polyprenyl-6-methoxyphenol hydroxylase-like FAD-dependent oxidoreductase
MTQHSDVLIAGAGPTGLVLALWLTKLGIKPRIIDKNAEVVATSRAIGVQARTLELYRQLDLADAVVSGGHKVSVVNFWVQGERRAQLPFRAVGSDLTPFSYLEIFPQDEHEKLLARRLEELGVAVERRTELVGFNQEADRVMAHLRGPEGREEVCEAAYLAGCDGARSLVRETLGTGFPGGTYRQVFYVADVQARGPALDGELHLDLDEADFLAIFPLAGKGRARLIGTVRDERADNAENLRFEDVSDRAIQHLKVEIQSVNWFSTYRVHHRVTEHFRSGRVLLVGDAAHIHSPVGGQGMNTGIGDAVNLAWKLQSVLTGRAADSLLDSYESERIRFARRLVATTDKVFTFVTAEGRIADLIRTRIAPALMPKLVGFESAREYLFRTASQIMINYRDSPLSAGTAGHVHGGDRLPWAPAAGADNFLPLANPVWQLHVYGTPGAELTAWCKQHNLPLHRFEWNPEHEKAGLARDAVYLIRPDTYVALADASGASSALDSYFRERHLRI